LINTDLSEPEIDVTTFADGWMETAFPWIIQSPDGNKWRIKISPTGNITTVSGETRAPSNYKVAKLDLTEASFAITNDGNVEVVSPPAGGETLMTTLYITSTGGNVWSVNVSNENQILTEKIFPV
jgi:hypothetical protein